MMLILIGLGLVGYGLFKMYKDRVERDSDQGQFNKHVLEYIKSIEETLKEKNDD